jgi:DNA-directed RNA polymerase subunit RPC12/RpoP
MEKRKREHFESIFAFGKKLSRRETRKYIRKERFGTKLLIKVGEMTKRTRFLCNHCGAPLKLHEWFWEKGDVIRCSRCNKEIMDIVFTKMIEMEGKK